LRHRAWHSHWLRNWAFLWINAVVIAAGPLGTAGNVVAGAETEANQTLPAVAVTIAVELTFAQTRSSTDSRDLEAALVRLRCLRYWRG
jgi:hypothetical protein